MIKVSFYNGGDHSPKEIFNWLKNQTPNSSGKWGKILGVEEIKDSDVIVVLGNKSYPFLKKFPQDKIQLRREPPFIEPFSPIPDAKLKIDYTIDGWLASTWWILKPFDYLQNLEYNPNKQNTSAIVSTKWGHRNNFFRELVKISNKEIHFYGRNNLKSIVGSENYMGPLNENWICKYEGLRDYKYSIAIENSQTKNYFSEKIIDCYLSWSMPIYWGCPNLSEHFPEDSYYNLDIRNPRAVIELIGRPITNKQIEALREARRLVMNKFNIWPTIERVLN